MGIDRILRAVYSEPWAILPEKLDAIIEFLELRDSGVRFTTEEIEARIGAQKEAVRGSKETAVIPVFGVLGRRMGGMQEISGGTSTERLEAQLSAALESRSVERIVLHVDSPGGTVQGTPETAARIREARAEKPVEAVIDGLGASAAFWIASAASKVFATPSSLVGSIGVIATHVDTSEAEEAAGVQRTVIAEPRFKGEDQKPLTDDAAAHLSVLVSHFYGMFVKDVAANRRTTQKAVKSEAWGEGRVIHADAALEAGMVDGISTVQAVVEGEDGRSGGMRAHRHRMLAKMAALDRTPEVE